MVRGLAQVGRLSGALGVFLAVGAASVSVLLASEVLLCSQALAQASARVPANALPSAPKTEYGAAINYQAAGNKATITQTAPTNIVSWKSFDIGSAASVNVKQPSSSAVLLNKVDGGAYLNKTVIDGMLSANGRVYVYNPNGIIFGKTATVNADTLIASSLKFDESRVIGGLVLPSSKALLGADPAYVGGVPGAVVVEGDAAGRAALTAGANGLILLAGPNVVNNGVLNAPDGQVILAAGSKVYLAAPNTKETGTNLRGLLVEVGNDYPAGTLSGASNVGTSTAENGESGQITVGRGNATMIGYAVNQNGIVSATTSATLNGSIYLYARDQATVTVTGDVQSLTPQRTGKLALGPNSVTEVLPDLNDATTIPGSEIPKFNPSVVNLNGADIELQENAKVLVPSGNVSIKAQRSSALTDVVTGNTDPKVDIARVDLGKGSVIDVSGTRGTQLAMESNVITVDLRGQELADNVVLRDSPMYATKVNIDVRKGTQIANVGDWIGKVEHGIGELTAAGGKVSIGVSSGRDALGVLQDGAIIQRAGSRIDVDGGYVDYLSGYVNTTQLRLNDKLVDIGAAQANTPYTAAVNLPNGPSNYEAGYRQGSSAGTVRFSAPIIVQQGDLSGQVTTGSHQRDVSATGYPKGGQLQIGNVTDTTVAADTGKADLSLKDQFGFTGNLVIGGTATEKAAPPTVGAVFDNTNPDERLLATQLDLDPARLADAGFNRITALTQGDINVVAPVTLAAGGRLWLGAAGSEGVGNISLNAPITIPGGSLTATAAARLKVGEGVGVDLAGRWTNDWALAAPQLDGQGNPITPVVLKGGKLSLFANQITLGEGVQADVSAGAWLDASGKTTLAGKAGAVTLVAEPAQKAKSSSDASLELGSGVGLSAYGFDSGGQLTMVGRNVTIENSSSSSSAADLSLQPGFFQQGGFSSYDIGANVNFTVAANAIVKPRASAWQFNTGVNWRPSGAMKAVAAPYLFDLSGPLRTRSSTNLTLRALSDTSAKDDSNGLLVSDGAQLVLDPGASLMLQAYQQLTVNGLLSAPAGRIVLDLPKSSNLSFSSKPTRSIWFGPNSEVLATGSTQRLYTDGDGVSSGDVLAGGTIQIGQIDQNKGTATPAAGYVVAEAGARFDVSGTSAMRVRFRSAGGTTPANDVASSGGSIDIRAGEGLLFAGNLQGGAGGVGASGGSLTVVEAGSTMGDANILNISHNAPTGGIVPRYVPDGGTTVEKLRPGDPLVVSKDGVGAFKGMSNNFLVGSGFGSEEQLAGQGWMTTSSFSAGGFGRLTFVSQDALAFGLGKADATLSASDAITLDAPILRADMYPDRTISQLPDVHTLNLKAPLIKLGSSSSDYRALVNSDDTVNGSPALSSTGNARLNARATTLDLIGNSALQGFGAAELSAKEDIRLVGTVGTDADGKATTYSRGSLAVTGNLTLTDAQTYPTTLSEFTLQVAPDPTDATTGLLKFVSNGNTPNEVLSAGGKLNVYASHIKQDGHVVAPFGTINMGGSITQPASLDSNNNLALDQDGKPVPASPLVTDDLEYAPGSVTSVAGSGVVPFGTVLNGSVPTASEWRVTLSGISTDVSIKQDPGSDGSVPEAALPAKTIVSTARSIKVDGGSVQDLSGGGALFAYEFTPGKGGSKDVLASSTTYAINPNFHASVAPIDGTYSNDTLTAGSKVYLSGMPGLAAGFYTLLPAHYALLPGGFSISLAANKGDMQAANNTLQADGSMLVSGRLVGAANNRSNGFIVSSGSVVRSKSEFTLYDATTYFADKATATGMAKPELPTDGGYVAFNALGNSKTEVGAPLLLNSAIKLNAAATGRAGMMDIAAPDITVVSSSAQSTGGSVQLVAGDLNAVGADSLLLGGLRDGKVSSVASAGNGDAVSSASTQHLSVASGSVTLRNDAQHPLNGAEVVIVADKSVTLESGAVLQGTGTLARAPQNIALDSGGSLLRVSSGDSILVTRAETGSNSASLSIADGARVAASGSATLDTTGSINLKGRLDLAPGSALSLAANGMRLGSDLSAYPAYAGLQIDTAGLAQFDKLGLLDLNSYASVIDLYGTVNLGGSTMQKLTFKGAGFREHGSADDLTSTQASFTADTVRFEGSLKNAAPSPSSASLKVPGTLAVQANTIEIAGNAFGLGGIAESTLTARGEIIAKGGDGALVADHNLTLAAGLIDTASGAVASFKAGERMTLTGVANSLTPASVGMGGQLSFSADSIVSDALIVAPSGKVSLAAPSGIDVVGGAISVAGGAVAFGSTTKYAPGGTIALTGGSVALENGAQLDLSSVGADAGSLSIAANSGGYASVQLNGVLKANAAAGSDGVLPAQGRFSLDADQAPAQSGQFGKLNASLDAAGFTESRQFRYRDGNVQMSGNDSITAHDVVISADNGNVSIGGAATIDASGAKGGSIQLYAAQENAGGNSGKVTLRDHARLDAHATAVTTSDAGSAGNGGRVVIGTAASANGDLAYDVDGGGSIDLRGGSIDVAGNSVGRNGSVTLRAPRLFDGSDVAIASMKTDIRNSAATTIEAYQVYQAGTVSANKDATGNLDATTSGAMYADASRFIAGNKVNILDRLDIAGNTNVMLAPGIEVRSAGDLTVSVNEFSANAADRGWNLNAWRFDGAPLQLTLRAAGNLNILGSISDGFVKSSDPKLAMPDWALDNGVSASYRLSGGAALAAANPLAVNAGPGDVYFGFADRTPTSAAPLKANDAPVALVRTGTGNIDVAAGNDITLGMAKFFTAKTSDPATDGRPLIYDAKNPNSPNYIVSLYGASVYTAGRATDVHNATDFSTPPSAGAPPTDATSATDAAGFTAPQNALNTHYGASANTLSNATFGTGGGAITMNAGHDVNGPHHLTSSDWFYRNADGKEAVAADPEDPTSVATAAVPGTKVLLSATVPQLVNDWLFRQGRSYVDDSGKVMFEKLDNGQTLNTAWWTRYDNFKQGVATFGGGDVRVMASGNVTDLSASVATSAYMSGNSPTALKEFGGGDLLVRAGGDIRGGQFYVQKGTATLRADGSVTAGNDVPTASFLSACIDCANPSSALNPVLALGDARFNVTAGRDLAIEAAYNPTLTMQSKANVAAVKGFSPVGDTWDVNNASTSSERQRYAQYSNLSTYGESSAVNLTAVSGDLLLANDAPKLSLASANDIPNRLGTTSLSGGYTLMGNGSSMNLESLYLVEPARVSAAALSGNLTARNGFSLAPAGTGQLELLAAGNVSLSQRADRFAAPIVMLDNDPTEMSNPYAPKIATTGELNVLFGNKVSGISAHALGGLHADDTQPARIVALTGDILGNSNKDFTVILPKQTEISAGRDIVDLGFNIQNNNATDVSSVVAGRDLVDSTRVANNDSKRYKETVTGVVTGPGRIDISAGRHVDLGNSLGVTTRGNLDNPYLAEGGASINVVAGAAQANYASLAAYLGQYGSVYTVSTSPTILTAAEQTDLVAYVRSLNPGQTTGLTPADALTLFKGLSAAQQAPFLDAHPAAADILALVSFVSKYDPDLPATASAEQTWAAFRSLPNGDQFLNEHPKIAARLTAQADKLAHAALLANGKPADATSLNEAFFSGLVEAATLVEHGNDASLANFDRLIASLFPDAAKAQAAGNISSFGSQFKTEQGGSIELFAPTGSVYAGLTTGSPTSRSPATQGLFTVRGGDIGALVRNDFLVNKGRVFTLGGGDIALASQYGNIDAGRGAKTASSAPPPLITIDKDGNVKVDVSSSISGSGIATLMTHPGQPPSNVHPIAPRGIFDAGDAGVRSTGSVDVVANVVLNANNISAGGAISGASATVAAPSVAPVAAPANAAAKSDDAAKALSNATQASPNAALSVEVMGYGDTGKSTDDVAEDGGDDGVSDNGEPRKRKKKN